MIEILGVEFTLMEVLFWSLAIIGILVLCAVGQQAQDEQKYKVSRLIDRLNNDLDKKK